MSGFFGDLFIPPLILAIKLLLKIQEELKFCLGKKKKTNEKQQNKLKSLAFFSSEKKPRNHFHITCVKHWIKLKIYSKMQLTDQVFFSKKKKKTLFKYFKYSGDFSLFNFTLKTYSNQYSHKQQHPLVLNFLAFLWRAPDKLSSQHLSYSLTSVGEKFSVKEKKQKKNPTKTQLVQLSLNRAFGRQS